MCLNYKLSPIFYMFAQISQNCNKSVLRFSNRDFDRTFVEILNSPNLDFRLRVTTTAKLFHADKNVSNEILQRKIKKRIVLKFILIKILKEFDPKHKHKGVCVANIGSILMQ